MTYSPYEVCLLFVFIKMNFQFKIPSLRSKRFRGVWEQRKTEERDFWYFSRAKNETRAKKRKRGVGRGERRNCLQANPWILKTFVRQQTELAIGWNSQILLTCVDQRNQTCEAFEGCLQKAF